MRTNGDCGLVGEPVGLIAGWGEFPVMVARALRALGHSVVCVGIEGHADASLSSVCNRFEVLGLTRLGGHIRYLKRHGIQRATMAGKIQKRLIFERGFLWRHIPDWTCVRTFFPHFVRGKRDRKDDSLLLAVVDAYAQHGISLLPATDFAPELLVSAGHLAGPPLKAWQQRDVEFGWVLAKEMGRLDVGQSVAVKGQAVLAVEAVEGTDLCIRRAGELCPSGGFTVVKVAKPQQDMRFDVPTIGVGTLDSMLAAGANVLAVEADKTIFINRDAIVSLAESRRITIVAME
ncbi:MAG: UDP-2,3-diacylglucosamine diphosphatase LpxI [Pirellulaceae bacterium]|nr:UDP-2,3-diacylglucosamine diphosphatase LpxI [Planctomycetales bacterium]